PLAVVPLPVGGVLADPLPAFIALPDPLPAFCALPVGGGVALPLGGVALPAFCALPAGGGVALPAFCALPPPLGGGGALPAFCALPLPLGGGPAEPLFCGGGAGAADPDFTSALPVGALDSPRPNHATANAPPPSPSKIASTSTIGHILRGGCAE